MRLKSLLALLFILPTTILASPIEVREIEMLIQSRIPQSEIIADVQRRKLSHVFSAQEIERAKAAGASSALITSLSDPSSVISASEAQIYEKAAARRRVAREQEEARIQSLPKMWVYGYRFDVPEGTGVGFSFRYGVGQLDVAPSRVASNLQRNPEMVIFEEEPPSFSIPGSKERFVNCEVAVDGMVALKVPGLPGTVGVKRVIMTKDLGKLDGVYPAPRVR